MANHRTYQAQALKVNAVGLGGVLTAGYNERVLDIAESQGFDGSLGPSEIDPVGKVVDFDAAFEDITKLFTLLAAAVTTGEYYERESGVDTFSKHVLSKPKIFGFDVTFAQGAQYARATVRATCEAANQTDGFKEIHAITKGQVAGTETEPVRLGAPKSILFGAAEITIAHLKSVRLMGQATLILDRDTGEDAAIVDVIDDWKLSGEIAFRDMSVTEMQQKRQELMAAGIGDLAVTIAKGSAGTADKILTARACRFTGPGRGTSGKQYTQDTVAFRLAAKKQTTPFTKWEWTGDDAWVAFADVA